MQESLPGEDAVLAAAVANIELNTALRARHQTTSFYLFHRARRWNGSEGVCGMGANLRADRGFSRCCAAPPYGLRRAGGRSRSLPTVRLPPLDGDAPHRATAG
jgi:hypothetical protein